MEENGTRILVQVAATYICPLLPTVLPPSLPDAPTFLPLPVHLFAGSNRGSRLWQWGSSAAASHCLRQCRLCARLAINNHFMTAEHCSTVSKSAMCWCLLGLNCKSHQYRKLLSTWSGAVPDTCSWQFSAQKKVGEEFSPEAPQMPGSLLHWFGVSSLPWLLPYLNCHFVIVFFSPRTKWRVM